LTRYNWAWMRFNATGQLLKPTVGPFPAGDLAFQDALAQLGGRWEEDGTMTSELYAV
jgi:hypothetical protein